MTIMLLIDGGIVQCIGSPTQKGSGHIGKAELQIPLFLNQWIGVIVAI